MTVQYSVVVPARDEEANVEPLYEAVKKVMDTLSVPLTLGSDESSSPGKENWELIIVDDGSGDRTYAKLREIRARDGRLKIIRFRRSFGQTAAWSAGFSHARGEYVIVMDADMQNDPADIPGMFVKMQQENLDVVSGWRKDRKDDGLLKLGSRVGNWVHRWVTGEQIHDHGCSLKIYKKEALVDLELYGEMHRYITALLSWKGFKVGEAIVRHHARRAGSTKYSIRKKLKGFLDLVVVKFWIQYSARPMHFFGTVGIAFILLGLLLGGALGALWLLRLISLAQRSSPLLAVLLVLLGFQFLLTGVLADVVAHTYYMQKKAYSVRSVDGFDEAASA